MKGMACGKFRRYAQNWQKACDHEKRILWLAFGQNKIFHTQWSWIRIMSTCLSCWPIHVLVLDVSSDLNCRNMIRNNAKNQHTKTQLKWRSLCAPLDIVPLLGLFFLYFFAIVVFWDSLTFYFIFLKFFLHLGAQKK